MFGAETKHLVIQHLFLDTTPPSFQHVVWHGTLEALHAYAFGTIITEHEVHVVL